MTVVVHMIVKYFLAISFYTILPRQGNRPKLLLDWKEYISTVAVVGIFSGFDIGLSNWGLELVPVSL